MKLVVYFARAHHPCCDVSLYDQIWPIFQRAVARHGYELIHLTDERDTARGDVTLRFQVDASLVMWAREHCWLDFLRVHASDDEQYCMVEPDMIVRERIPELLPGEDFLLLQRALGDCINPGFRLVKRSALPFYETVVARFADSVPPEKRAWHGDVQAHHLALNFDPSHPVPRRWRDLGIAVRKGAHYGVDGHRSQGVVIQGFKGSSKATMLREQV